MSQQAISRVNARLTPSGLVHLADSSITVGTSYQAINPESTFYYDTNVGMVMPIQQSTPPTVKEIHDAFKGEGDRLLEIASATDQELVGDRAVIEKGERLAALGFKKSKDVVISNVERARIQESRKKIDEARGILSAIEYFQHKYPQYKFITEESVIELTNKYGLVYGDAEYYTGTVPDKNLAEIEAMKIDEGDDCYHISEYEDRRGIVSGKRSLKRRHYVHEEQADRFMITRRRQPFREEVIMSTIDPVGFLNGRNVNTDHFEAGKCNLEIIAPISDFDTSQMELRGTQLMRQYTIPDPIVLKPVHYNGKKHYLIITAWGDEASDELVVNEKMN